MAFRSEDKPTEFLDLKKILAQSKVTDNALYQTIQILLERLEELEFQRGDVVNNITNSINIINNIINGLLDQTATFITSDNEVGTLPNSRQLLPGTNVAFDDTAPNKRVINALASGNTDLEYLGDYVPGNTYNDGDIVVGPDGITYVCTKDGITTPPEPWPGSSPGSIVHHTTHEPGGGDQIQGAAWVNLTNIFTQRNTFTKDGFAAIDIASPLSPLIQFTVTSQPLDQKKWEIYANSGGFYIQATNDAENAVVSTPLRILRNGDATFYGNLTVNGVNGNVAQKDKVNIFTQSQHLALASPGIVFNDTAQVADGRKFRILNTGQQLLFDAVTDAETAVVGRIGFYRNGAIQTNAWYHEANRVTPMGYWTALNPVVFAGAGTVTIQANNGCQYTLIGKTMIICFYLVIVTSASTVNLGLQLPAGYTGNATYTATPFLIDTYNGLAQSAPSGQNLNLYRDAALTAIPAGTHTIAGNIAFPIA